MRTLVIGTNQFRFLCHIDMHQPRSIKNLLIEICHSLEQIQMFCVCHPDKRNTLTRRTQSVLRCTVCVCLCSIAPQQSRTMMITITILVISIIEMNARRWWCSITKGKWFVNCLHTSIAKYSIELRKQIFKHWMSSATI